MEIRIVDINDASHPLKTGEMEIDRVNNVMYVGGQFGVADMDFRGIINILNIYGVFERLRDMGSSDIIITLQSPLKSIYVNLVPNTNYITTSNSISISTISDIKGVFEHAT